MQLPKQHQGKTFLVEVLLLRQKLREAMKRAQEACALSRILIDQATIAIEAAKSIVDRSFEIHAEQQHTRLNNK